MSFTFQDLQTEVKRRATRDQGGTGFDDGIKNTINASLFRIARECPWVNLRRKTYVTTEGDYTTGSGNVAVTNGSKNVTVTGALLITAGIKIGRYVTLGGSTDVYQIRTITGETTFTVDKSYDGTTSTTQTYKIYGNHEYNLPIQATKIFAWHDEFGYPYQLSFIPDQEFFSSGVTLNTSSTPTHYRMWGENMVISQPKQAGVMRVASSSSSDTSKVITVFGTVSGYPDFEQITTNASNGTTAVSGTKSFSEVERVVKDSSTVGRITVDADSANTTIAVLPVGDTTAGILYKKMQIWPLPQSAFEINIYYYKNPYRLVNNQDVHELGQDFDEALILLSTAKMKYEQNQTTEGDKFFGLYTDEMKTLRRTNMDRMDWLPQLLRPKHSMKRHPYSFHGLDYLQLGGNYGPMSRM